MTEIDHLLQLPPEPASAGHARRFVTRALRGCNVDIDLVTLLVSELVSNGVLHARTVLELSVRSRGTNIRVSVADESVEMPAMKHYGADAVTGRGLTMIDANAARWGVDERSTGKSVWFEVPIVAPVRP